MPVTRLWNIARPSIILAVVNLITGVSGQDGSYLAEQLVDVDEQVIGVLYPREELPDYFSRLDLSSRCKMAGCDVSDPQQFRSLLRENQPDRVYHLAAMSSPSHCEEYPEESRQLNVTSIEVLLDWIKRERSTCRALVVSSAAIFGSPQESPQTEETPVAPLNEYGRQKLQVRELARDAAADGLFVACAIPYNHESPRRREDFVIAKIVNSAARIASGRQQLLELGNISAKRDWGYAPEYVAAYSWMLDIEKPTDLILSTGDCNSVSDAVDLAFAAAGLDPGELVLSDPEARSLPEAAESVGNPEKAWRELGWEASIRFPRLIEILTEAALSSIKS